MREQGESNRHFGGPRSCRPMAQNLPKSLIILIIKMDWGLDEIHTADEKTGLRSRPAL